MTTTDSGPETGAGAVSPTGSGASRLDPDLLARLARCGVTVGVPDTPRPSPGAPPAVHVTPIESAVPGRMITTAHGTCYLSIARLPGDHVHGGEVLGEALRAPTAALVALGGRRHGVAVDVADTVFLDTETTGLAGGTGTYAFLIGAGRFVDGAFHVRQYFMRDPSEERCQLAELAGWVAGCTGLVTFNGRSFDMPLLSARYALQRAGAPLGAAGHLDLLPLSRRLWRRRLDSCALTSLEHHVLGFDRQDDVPGWLIPERYLHYQRDGDARPLVSVFRHNVFDILSMVSLLVRLARIGTRPEEALHHGRDWLSLAVAHEARRNWAGVVSACEGALARGLPVPEADEARRRLALAHRRRGDWACAVDVWSGMTDAEPPRCLFPFEELSKFHEHHVRPPDLARALACAERARDLVARGELRPSRGRTAALCDLDHRIARLQRRRRASEG